MPGKGKAVSSGNDLKNKVMDLGENLGLKAQDEVKVGRRIWGAVRNIDVVLTHQTSGRKIGIECKFQGGGGSAEEKIPATIEDIKVWPIRGLVVFDGPGFSKNMDSYLVSTGMAVKFTELSDWLKLYFSLDT